MFNKWNPFKLSKQYVPYNTIIYRVLFQTKINSTVCKRDPYVCYCKIGK